MANTSRETKRRPGPAARRRARAAKGFALGILLVVALALYANSLGNPYVSDDRRIVEDNPIVTTPTLAGFFSLWTLGYWQTIDASGETSSLLGDDRTVYRPITVFSYWLNALPGTTGSESFRVGNVVLHGLAAWAVGLWVAAWMGDVAGMLAAAVVVFHPVATDVINRIAGRADILALLGIAGSLVAQRRAQSLGWTWGRTALTMLAVSIALGAKESGLIVIPLALLQLWLVEARDGEHSGASLLRQGLAFGLPLGLYVVARQYALAVAAGRSSLELPSYGHDPTWELFENPLIGLPWWDRLASVAALASYYTKLLVWPWPLSAFDSPTALPTWTAPLAIGGHAYDARLGALLLVAAACALCVLAVRRRPLALAPAWLLVSFLLVGQLLVPLGTYAEARFAYPMLGSLAFLSGWAVTPIRDARRRWQVAAVAVAAISLLAATAIVRRNEDFRSEVALLEAEVRDKPKDPAALTRLGLVYLEAADAGADAEEKRRLLMQAEGALGAATALTSKPSHVWFGLCLVRDGMADTFDATDPARARALRTQGLEDCRRATESNPRHYLALNFLASAAREDGDPRTAETLLEQAYAIVPRNRTIALNLASLELEQGQGDAAIRRLDLLLAEHPRDTELRTLRAEYVAVAPAVVQSRGGAVAAAIATLESGFEPARPNETALQFIWRYTVGSEETGGDLGPAIARLQGSLALHPDYRGTAMLLERTSIARAAREREAGRATNRRDP